MATYEKYPNIPGVTSTFEDGGLDIPRPVDLGDSILVIGSAGEGPINQPLVIRSLDEAKAQFGRFDEGTLVRGLFEVFSVSQAGKDVRGMRIGPATKASLSLAEDSTASGTSMDDATVDALGVAITDSIVITAIKEGTKYNDVSVRIATVSGLPSLIFYNPVSGVETAFSYIISLEEVDPNWDIYDVHNLTELKTAIEADSNLNRIIEVQIKDLATTFTAHIGYDADLHVTNAPWSTGCLAETNGDITLSLYKRLDTNIVGIQGGIDYPSGVITVDSIHADDVTNLKTAGNNLTTLLEVWDYPWVENNMAATYPSDHLVGSGTYGGEWVSTAGKTYVDLSYAPAKPTGASDVYFAEETYDTDADGFDFSGTPVCRQIVRNGFISHVTAVTTVDYTFDGIYAAMDPLVAGDSEPLLYRTLDGVKTTVPKAEYTTAYSGTLNRYTWTLPSTGDWSPVLGSLYTTDLETAVITLTEYTSKAGAEAAGAWTDYFVSGKRVYFGDIVPTDLLLTYRWKRNFAIGGDVSLFDAKNGVLKFTNSSKTPKTFLDIIATHATWYNRPHLMGFRYGYLSEWATFTAAAKSLGGGGNGTTMTNEQLYVALDTAYTALENYEVDIIVPMGAYIDATKNVFDEVLGQYVESNAGFHTQLTTFLEGLQEGVNETLGVLAVTPANSKSISDVTDWYNKLTVIDSTDPFRGANVMAALDSRWLSIAAFEPILSNGEIAQPYTASGECSYAGLISGLPAKSATTNKRMDNVIGTRFKLSKRQVDTLIKNRYVISRRNGSSSIVIADGVTAAAKGSDYTRLSTIRIVVDAMTVTRSVCEPFIGEPNDSEQRNAMDTAIRQGLQRMVEDGALRDYNFDIISTPAMQVAGEIDIDLILVPAFEIRRIRVTVKLRPSL